MSNSQPADDLSADGPSLGAAHFGKDSQLRQDYHIQGASVGDSAELAARENILSIFGAGEPLDFTDPTFDINVQLPRYLEELVVHPLFQRMKGVSQTIAGQIDKFDHLTYSRFEHSIGAASQMIAIIEETGFANQDPELAKVMIVTAAIHDVLHGPASHTIERPLKKRCGFDHDENLREGYHNKMFKSSDGEVFAEVLDRVLAGTGYNSEKLVGELLQCESPLYLAAKSLAERLDYIPRDMMSLMKSKAGKQLFQDQEFIELMQVDSYPSQPWSEPKDVALECIRARSAVVSNLHFENGLLYLEPAGVPAMTFLANARNVFSIHASLDPETLLYTKLLKRDVTRGIVAEQIAKESLPYFSDEELFAELAKVSKPVLSKFPDYKQLFTFKLSEDVPKDVERELHNKEFQGIVPRLVADHLGIPHSWEIMLVRTPQVFTTPIKVYVKEKIQPASEALLVPFGPEMPASLCTGAVYVHKDAESLSSEIEEQMKGFLRIDSQT